MHPVLEQNFELKKAGKSVYDLPGEYDALKQKPAGKIPSRRRSKPNLAYPPTSTKNDTSGEALRRALAEDKKRLEEQSRNASRIRGMHEAQRLLARHQSPRVVVWPPKRPAQPKSNGHRKFGNRDIGNRQSNAPSRPPISNPWNAPPPESRSSASYSSGSSGAQQPSKLASRQSNSNWNNNSLSRNQAFGGRWNNQPSTNGRSTNPSHRGQSSGNQPPNNRTTGSRMTNSAPRTRSFKGNLSDSSSSKSSHERSSSENSSANSGSSESDSDSSCYESSSADPSYVESSSECSPSDSSVSRARPPTRRAPARVAARQPSPACTPAKRSLARRSSVVSLPSSSPVVPSSPCRKRQKRKDGSSSSKGRSKSRARSPRMKQEPTDDEEQLPERAGHRQSQDEDQDQPDGTRNQRDQGQGLAQNVRGESGHSCEDIKAMLSGMMKEATEEIRQEIRGEIQQAGELSNGTASFCVETVLQVGEDLSRSQRKMKRKLDKIASEKKKRPRKHKKVLSESSEEEADVRSVALPEEKDGNSNSSGSGAETGNKPARVEGPAPQPVPMPPVRQIFYPLRRFPKPVKKKTPYVSKKSYANTPPASINVSPVPNPFLPRVEEDLKRIAILENLDELGPEQAQAAFRDEVEYRFRELEVERMRKEVEQGIRGEGDVEGEEQLEDVQHTPTQEEQQKKAEWKALRKAEKEALRKAEEKAQRKAEKEFRKKEEKKTQRKAEKEARKQLEQQQRKLRGTGSGSMWDPVILDD